MTRGTPTKSDLEVVERFRLFLSMPLTDRQRRWLAVRDSELTAKEQAELCKCPNENCVVHGRMPAAEGGN